MNNTSNPPVIFISHSSKDKAYAEEVVKLLKAIGLKKESIFCSSVPGHQVPLGKDIYEYLRTKLSDANVYIVFLLSNNFYNSVACLNEMGAVWVFQKGYQIILLPKFKYEDIQGVINSNLPGIELDGDKRELNHRLLEFRNTILDKFTLPKVDEADWFDIVQTFVSAIENIPSDKQEEDNTEFEKAGFQSVVFDALKCEQDLKTPLSDDAIIMLLAAVHEYGEIQNIRFIDGAQISAGRVNFLGEDCSPRNEARWQGALEELEKSGFVSALNYKRELFRVTREGYNYSDNNGPYGLSPQEYEFLCKISEYSEVKIEGIVGGTHVICDGKEILKSGKPEDYYSWKKYMKRFCDKGFVIGISTEGEMIYKVLIDKSIDILPSIITIK